MTHNFQKIAEIPYKGEVREAFQFQKLYKKWYQRYPELFDELDLQNAKSQAEGGSHFHEWLGAILLFQITGWHSLQQKYQFEKHSRKRSILEKLEANSLIKFFNNQKSNNFGSLQAPDLLVYSPDYSEWFMCEVKGPNDKLREEQIEYFEALKKATGATIQRLKLILM